MTTAPTRSKSARRIIWLRIVLAAALASGFLLSPKLWLSSRSYPLSPVMSFLPRIPSPLDIAWFAALFAALAAVAVLPRRRWPIVAFLVPAGLLALWDQSRWQPWFYQYFFMLGAVAIGSARRRDGDAGLESILQTCRVIVAATYVWSGIHKLNLIYVNEGFPWLIEPLVSHLPEAVASAVRRCAIPSAVLESFMGFGLLLRPLRSLSIALALAMHIFILLAIGPLGHNWNSIVWPWNPAMMFFVVILFWSTRDVSIGAILRPGGRLDHVLVLVLFGAMPLLSFFDLWDTSLSASLYSGNAIRGTVQISDEVRQRLPAEIQPHVRRSDSGEYRIEINAWAMDELNIPAYPARRVYRDIARTICRYGTESGDVVLSIRQRPHWLSSQRDSVTYECGQM